MNKLRQITNADFPLLLELVSPLWHSTYDNIVGAEQADFLLHKYFDTENIEAYVQSGYQYFYIVHEGQVGGLLVFVDRAADVYLDKLYVTEPFRRKGLASFAIRKLHEMGKDIRLNVNRNNEIAIATYKNRGFEVEKEENIKLNDTFANCDYVMLLKAEQ